MIKRILLSIATLLCLTQGMSQSRQEAEDTFKDANAYFYFEDYEEALALYLSIYKEFPDNANLDYRIGFCYLNIPGSKHKAIPYLERASENTSKRYNETSLRETKAPTDALFYLANAYFANNQLSKATQTYNLFKSEIRSERLYNMEYFNNQIETISRARVAQNYPVNFLRSNIGPNINNRFPNYNPVLSGDGKTFAYTTKERFYQAIYVASKEGDEWGRPRNITLDLVVDGNCSTLSLSYDGTEIYLYKDDNHDGNIYVSNLKNGAWSPMRKLNSNINTEFYETHACLSPDGKRLYFTSNRRGGYGDLDIYVSERTSGENWGPAKNLGPNVNSPLNENTPFLTTDGNTLFFSTEGHSSIGGYDIVFANRMPDGKWSKPINIGYPINTTDDNLFYQPVGDGGVGYMAVFDPVGFGDQDIAQIEIFLPKYKRMIVTSGEYFERKKDLPLRTLVVDTVNVSGVALLDPSKPGHFDYLSSDKMLTLFFDGKPYDLRDQELAAKSLTALLAQKAHDEQIKQTKPTPSPDPLTAVGEQAEIRAETGNEEDNKTLSPESQVYSTDIHQPTRGVDNLDTSKILKGNDQQDQSFKPEKNSKQEQGARQITAEQSQRLEGILTLLSKGTFAPLLAPLLAEIINTPKPIIRSNALAIAHLADSLGRTTEFIELFARLSDLISTKSVQKKFQQSRRIAQTTYNEDFFFRLQQLKRGASPGLAEILDEAILTQPQIVSFHTLWQYLINNKETQIKPYLTELLTLLAASGIDDFFELSEQDQIELLQSLSSKPSITPSRAISFAAVLMVILLIAILARKRRKSNK